MKKLRKLKIVFDINILISFFCYPSGIIREIVKQIFASDYEVFLSEEILDEFSVVVKRKFPELKDDLWQFIKFLNEKFIIINPVKKLDIIKQDPTDNKIIECAVAVKANYIISGISIF